MNIFFFLSPKDEIAYVSEEATLLETMGIMEEYSHSVLPMITKDGKYAGIVSEGDIYYTIKNTYNFDVDRFSKIKISELDARRSYAAMNVNAPVEEMYQAAIRQNFIPVIDDKDIFIGIVKRRDVLQYFFKKYMKSNEK